MRKLILRNHQAPGDIVMLTAAVRDLHRCYPGEFITDVRTSCPDLWRYNPNVTPLAEGQPGVEVIDCHYPLIHRCNREPWHFLHAFVDDLNDRLGVRVGPTAHHGDIYLSAPERLSPSPVQELVGARVPFWIVCAGGKSDFTIKWWDHARYQAVVDHFRGRVLFAQIGERHHHHPALAGVLDLRGRTDLRGLVRLTHHAQGVLGPVSLPMHLAAAVAVGRDMPLHRPCVVVAGGREPPHWAAYPHHQFLHTVGALPCCDSGGCWRSRTVALGDGDEKDRAENLCVDVVQGLPRCMDLISAADVIRRIEMYFEGKAVRYLSAAAGAAAVAAVGRLAGRAA